MPLKNTEGLKSFFIVQSAELAEVKASAASIPRKITLLDQVESQELKDCIRDSIAFKIHGIYTALESIFQNVAKELDGYIPSGETWHFQLLSQMGRKINDRDQVISQETGHLLNELRSFRHFIRNDYGAELNISRVIELAAIAENALNKFSIDWECFQKNCFDNKNPASGESN